MRLAIVNITAGGISGGYRKYLRAMLPRLARASQVSALQCIVPEAWQAPSWFENGAVPAFVEYSASRIARLPGAALAGIARFAPDIVFVPSERVFCYSRAPVANMFRNLEPFAQGVRQGSALERMKTIARRRDARRMFTRTATLIVPSAFVRKFLEEHENVPQERVQVIHYGSEDLSAERLASLQPPLVAQHGIRPGFLLTAGAVRPARGLEDALHALAAIRDRHGRNDTLVIAGELTSRTRGYRTELERLCHRLGVTPHVVWAGHLARQELCWCFRHCAAFLMTTQAETFSNLAVEALANGCMIVATNSSCLPEILSDAAHYYTPGNPHELAHAAVTAASLRGEARASRERASRGRAAQFSWDVTASKTLSVLADTIHSDRVRTL